jgi:hypothetical protein
MQFTIPSDWVVQTSDELVAPVPWKHPGGALQTPEVVGHQRVG